MLAFFHNHIFWTEFVDVRDSGDDIVFLNELCSLAIVEHKAIDPLKQLEHRRKSDV